jgi:hypothetical protein
VYVGLRVDDAVMVAISIPAAIFRECSSAQTHCQCCRCHDPFATRHMSSDPF